MSRRAGHRTRPRVRRYGRLRRAVQAAVALLFAALPFLATPRAAGTYVALKLGPVDLLEPASALAAALAARSLAWTVIAAAVPLVIVGVLLGPVYCAWGCPFGLLSELLDALRQRRNRRRERTGTAHSLRWTETASRSRAARFALLATLLLASVPLGLPLAALVAPPRLLTALPLELQGARGVPWVTVSLLATVLALELAGPRRLVCRVLCPAGALAALLRRRWTLRPTFDGGRCLCPGHARCFQECPWAVDPRSMRTLDGCTTCLACIDACPPGALTLSGPWAREAHRAPPQDDGGAPRRDPHHTTA